MRMTHRNADRGLRPFLLALALAAAAAFGVSTRGQAVQTEIVADGVFSPFLVLSPPVSGDDRLFIAEQRGVIKILDDGEILPTWFLDIRDKVIAGGLQGMLGFAFHPDYENNRHFYVYYTDLNGDSMLERYTTFAGLPDVADPASATTILQVPQPHQDHNGGQIVFGSDGYLYLGMGDGGEDIDPNNLAQDPSTLLGKLLRIDVDGGSPYAIPADNPFVGEPGYREEIWALGLRNPWGIGFDSATGDLWMVDVGHLGAEEVNYTPASSTGGENYGWRLMEGSDCFNPPVDCDPDGDLQLPIHEYAHTMGNCSITGGYVYRGSMIPELQGMYFFSDYCSGRVWGLRYDGSMVYDFTDWTAQLSDGGSSVGMISGFGLDGDGELYIVDRGTSPGTGTIFKIIPGTSDAPDPPVRDALRLSIGPNPSPGPVRLALQAEPGARITVEIVSIEGRRLWSESVWADGAGLATVTWAADAESGDRLASGTYFARARTESQSVTRKVHVAR